MQRGRPVAGFARRSSWQECRSVAWAEMKPQVKSTPRCPLRPGDPCSLCWPGASGPQDCGLVYLVMDDPELRDLYVADRKQRRARKDGSEGTRS